MQRKIAALALAVAAGALGGCGLFQDVQSISREMAKSASDQDDIATGAPLALPPDMTLRPPAAGTSSPEGTARRAQVILRTSEEPAARTASAPGRGARETGPSAGEREVLARAGFTGSTSDVVRRTVDIEQTRRASGQRDFTDRVLKYDPKAKPAEGEDKSARDATGDRPVIKRPGEF